MGKTFIAFDNNGSRTPNRKILRGKTAFRNDSNSFNSTVRSYYLQPPNTTNRFVLVTDSNTYKGKSTATATPVFIDGGTTTTTLTNAINQYRAAEYLGGSLSYDAAIAWWVQTYNGLIVYNDRLYPTPLLRATCRAVYDPAFENLGLIDAAGKSGDYVKIAGNAQPVTNGDIISWRFDGTSAIRLGGISSFNPDADYPIATTLNMWFKADNVSTQQAILSDNYGPEWGFWVGGTSLQAYAYGGTNKVISADTWYMATLVTLDAYPASGTTTRKFYVDGALVGTGANTTGNGLNDTPFTLGYDYKGGSPANYLTGYIGHTSFWNAELNSSEISALYEATKHSYGF